MSKSVLTTLSYESEDRQVSWRGVCMSASQGFDAFMTNDVASRLHDDEAKTEFENHVRALPNTGFAIESLNAILAAEIPEDRDWAIGEAVAEAYLSRELGVIWPWNMERDKRHFSASMPGADLVGFTISGDKIHLALGEAKTSSDAQTPPGVMNGRHGMAHQIDKLANDLSLIGTLLRWLLPRCKGTKHETSFNTAIGLYFESGNKAVALFGVLVRDTQPNEMDLEARGRTLAKTLHNPTTCQLIAIYLPCPITDLAARVSGGRS